MHNIDTNLKLCNCGKNRVLCIYNSLNFFTLPSSQASNDPSYIGVIVGVIFGIVGIFIVIVLVAVCVVFMLRLKSSKKKSKWDIISARFNCKTDYVAFVTMEGQHVQNNLSVPRDLQQIEEYDDLDTYIAPYSQISQTEMHSVLDKKPNTGAKGYEKVVRQEDPVSGIVLIANQQPVLYDTIADGGRPIRPIYETIDNQYGYVPNENARREGTLSRNPAGIEEELRSIYQGVVNRQYEDIPYVPPGEKLNTLYDQLADKKCIEIPRAYLKQESVLGTGEFGDVFKGVWETPYGPQDVAIKMLKSGSNEKDKINFLKEAALMGQFRHPHVIRLLGTVTVVDPCMIVLEFLAGKDLESYLHDHRPEPGVLPESSLPFQLLKFCCEIADGMKYLSNKGFIHRDLATRNVLLDKNLQCKIADFGLSKTLQSDSEYYIAKGGRVPVRWTAPEALHYKKYTISSDVWSFGMTMYEIWSLGEKPFSQMDALNVVKKLQREVSYVQPPPPGCPRDMYRLMVYCWDRNHHSRPTFGAIFGVLSGPPDSLLLLPSDDLQQTKDPSKAGQLGMPLEFGEDLYQDLQHYYNSDEA
jgi:tRNA A-37 threonylcarbamoyl transferase component Bud32